MSDIDVLSHEYKTSSDLSTSLNSAIIAAKRLRYGLPLSDTLTKGEIRSYQNFLSGFLVGLSRLMSDKGEGEWEAKVEEPTIPGSLVEKARNLKQTVLPHYLKDLKKAVERLNLGFQHLTEEDIRLLDELCRMSDAETSSLFRRLWRK
jgi:hypothetical protein